MSGTPSSGFFHNIIITILCASAYGRVRFFHTHRQKLWLRAHSGRFFDNLNFYKITD